MCRQYNNYHAHVTQLQQFNHYDEMFHYIDKQCKKVRDEVGGSYCMT